MAEKRTAENPAVLTDGCQSCFSRAPPGAGWQIMQRILATALRKTKRSCFHKNITQKSPIS